MEPRKERLEGLRTWFPSSTLPALLLGAFALLLYINSAGNSFVFDDLKQLAENPALASQSWLDFFKQDVWAFLGEGKAQSNAYRPLQMLSYAALVRWIGHQPFFFHLLNILLHALNTILVYVLIRRLGQSFVLALIAGGLFAAHPVHAQTVNFIGALPDLLCTLFVLIALLLAVQAEKGRQSGSGGRRGPPVAAATSGPQGGDRYAPAKYWLGLVAFVGALLSKELGLVLPALLVALWLVHSEQRSIPVLLRRLVPYLGVIAAYVAIRIAALGYFHRLTNQFSATSYEINLFRIRLLGAYLEKLVWPDGLSMYYAFRATRSLLQPEVLVSLLAIVGLTVALWRWRRAEPGGRMAWLGWLWTLLALMPMMNLRALGSHVFADWYLYLPSLGFVLLIAAGLEHFRVRFKALTTAWRSGFVVVTVALVVVAYSAATLRQNTHWKDGYTLFAHGVQVSPNSAFHRINYAHQLVLRNRLDEAMAQDREAIRLAPHDFGLSPEAIFAPEADLGWMLFLKGEIPAAEQHLRNATRIQPKNPVGYMRLGYVLERAGKLREALEAFGRAAEFDRRNAFTYLARGNVFVKLKQDEEAIQEFELALSLEPRLLPAYDGLILALERQGRLKEAREWRARLLAQHSGQGEPGQPAPMR